MRQTLILFADNKTSLFDAASAFLKKLGIVFDAETAEPVKVDALYDDRMPKYLIDALVYIENTFFIGVANDESLSKGLYDDTLENITQNMDANNKYSGMFIFACDTKPNNALSRVQAATLTRAFNRISRYNPVILFIRQSNLLSVSTCEH